jgi:predicted nucleotidyltransferase
VACLAKLPEKVRKTLEKQVAQMRVAQNVYGIGLFGSWSRGDATPSSDVDLLIVDNGDFSYEYVERKETNDLFIDLDHVPKRWMRGPIPPEIDQKLYEMQILYDRDWSMNDTKVLMVKSYSSPERVDIRTETHVIDSDIYLSRATSAFSREDFKSAYLFATVALESILNVLVEIASEPFSNSRFIERLEVSTEKLEMHDLFEKYLTVSKLDKENSSSVKDKLEFFQKIWNEMNVTTKQHIQVLESSHFRVKARLNYYLNPAFLEGALMRVNSMIDSEKAIEASHYLKNIFLSLVENYVWLKAAIDKVKVDHTTLADSLETLEKKSPANYNCMMKLLNLDDVAKLDAARAIEESREIILKIRKDRKVLIKNHS